MSSCESSSSKPKPLVLLYLLFMMDVEKYLARIRCPPPCPPTLETLRRLHLNHLLSVPFEDLSIHSGEKKIQLHLPSIYQKLVLNTRGGFCYENNGLFSWLLDQLGFQVEILAAQVRNRFTNAYGPPFDHFIMTVTLDGHRWLCDVGFGSGFQLPLSLDSDSSQIQSHGVYRVRTQAGLFFVETLSESDTVKKPEGEGPWVELYKFTLQARRREDFEAMCEYHQSSESSIFFCKSLCTMLLPAGRITILGRTLHITRLTAGNGLPAKTRRDLSDEEVTEILKDTFGIVLSSPLIPKDVDIVPPTVN